MGKVDNFHKPENQTKPSCDEGTDEAHQQTANQRLNDDFSCHCLYLNFCIDIAAGINLLRSSDKTAWLSLSSRCRLEVSDSTTLWLRTEAEN